MENLHTVGISNQIKTENGKIFWNYFMDVDTKDERIFSIIDKHMIGDYMVINTNKGYHIMSLFAFHKDIEKDIFFLISKELEKIGIKVDYIHYSEYSRIEEDFKVLRIGKKEKNIPDLEFKTFRTGEYTFAIQILRNFVFTMDLLRLYATDKNMSTMAKILLKYADFPDVKYHRETVFYQTPKR